MLKSELSKEFDIKDLGEVRKIVDTEIKKGWKDIKLWLSQSSYVEKVLERFKLDKSKSVSTPMLQYFRLSLYPTIDKNRPVMSYIPCAQVVGCLMYIMVYTRVDITQAFSVVLKYMSNPRKEYSNVVKCIMKYLWGTTRYGILCSHGTYNLIGFVDSDYVGDLDQMRSTT